MENQIMDRPIRPDNPFTHLEQYQAYAHDRFLKADWPTCREEPWRRTDITAVDFDAFIPHDNPHQGQTRALADKSHVAGYAYFNGTHANGFYLADSLKTRGVFLGPLAQGIEAHPAAYQQAFIKTQSEQDKFILWNYSSITHGVYLVFERVSRTL